MNKLISKNPVLRFKNGLKILKFLSGGTAYNNLARKWGTKKNAKGEEFIRDPKTGNVFFKDGRIIENNGSGEVRKANTFGGTKEFGIVKGSTDKKPIVTNTARQRDYKSGEVEYKYDDKSGKWMARWTNSKRDNPGWYYVAEGSTGYDVNGNHNIYRKGKWEKIPEDESSTNPRTLVTTGARTGVLPNRAVNGYTLPEGVNDVAEVLRQLIKEKYLLPKVDGLWGAETQAAWEAKKSFDELQNMKENFGNNHPTPTTISPELQQAFTRTTPDYIGESTSTNEPLAFLLPQKANRKYVRSMIRTFGRNPYGDYTPQERTQMRNEINNGTFDVDKWFGELGLNNILPTQSDLQTVATSSTNTPPSSLYNMGGFNRFLINWLNQNPGIYNNLANIFTTYQPSVATPTYVPNYNMNYNENNPLTYRYATSIYKQGGLISKNPVKLFKTNFRKGAL